MLLPDSLLDNPTSIMERDCFLVLEVMYLDGRFFDFQLYNSGGSPISFVCFSWRFFFYGFYHGKFPGNHHVGNIGAIFSKQIQDLTGTF